MKKLNKNLSHLRIQWSHLAILLAGIFIAGFLLFKGVTWLFHDPYAAYQTYKEDTKLAGEMKHTTQKEKDAYFISYTTLLSILKIWIQKSQNMENSRLFL